MSRFNFNQAYSYKTMAPSQRDDVFQIVVPLVQQAKDWSLKAHFIEAAIPESKSPVNDAYEVVILRFSSTVLLATAAEATLNLTLSEDPEWEKEGMERWTWNKKFNRAFRGTPIAQSKVDDLRRRLFRLFDARNEFVHFKPPSFLDSGDYYKGDTDPIEVAQRILRRWERGDFGNSQVDEFRRSALEMIRALQGDFFLKQLVSISHNLPADD